MKICDRANIGEVRWTGCVGTPNVYVVVTNLNSQSKMPGYLIRTAVLVCTGVLVGGPSLPIVVFASDCEKLGAPILAGVAVGFEDVWNSVLDFAFMRYEAASDSPFPKME